MKRILLGLSLVALIITLIGCGPVYKREYTFVAPKSNISKMCIAQCVQGKNVCEQSCNANVDNCRARAHQDAIYQYEAYKHERHRKGKSVDKSISDFDTGNTCTASCNCEPTYRACYSACGGQVLQHDVCVAFCNK